MPPNKCIFGFEGKFTVFSFTNNPALHEQWMQFVVTSSIDGIKCVCVFWSLSDGCFMNKAQVDAGFANRLLLKHGAVPVIKEPIHSGFHLLTSSFHRPRKQPGEQTHEEKITPQWL
ncbi:uncharacterized protein LOC113068523 isoform X2 [Carassius auratus]|uniref:Uncharacterized protein LOC113068523 isoform X2 n=1 Tax=Carassius auratus TaxID=7957 RepID=A0A6P6MLW3_CARAU|nr:uncharacterized protein LOC113068523 isoform X2 [Carassius auratus]